MQVLQGGTCQVRQTLESTKALTGPHAYDELIFEVGWHPLQPQREKLMLLVVGILGDMATLRAMNSHQDRSFVVKANEPSATSDSFPAPAQAIQLQCGSLRSWSLPVGLEGRSYSRVLRKGLRVF